MKRVHLVLIDCQSSFVDIVDPTLQQVIHSGELCVPNAINSQKTLAEFITKRAKIFEDIHATLDSHHLYHIAHPIWYKGDKGQHPNPFTLMSNVNGEIVGSDSNKYVCTIPSMQKWTLDYLAQLAKNNRYPHCLWPPHCLIGTKGHAVTEPVFEALQHWCQVNLGTVNWVTKGSNPKVEHFSGVKSEVVDPNDFTTQLNTGFIQMMMEADEILFAGEAKSHCLLFTMVDIANEFANGNLGSNDEFLKKCVLLDDCANVIPSFEDVTKKKLDELVKRGMKITTTKDY